MEIFLAAPPGLEPFLADEARAQGFANPTAVPGGVTVRGGWPEVWRANLVLRGTNRVLARLGEFRVFHLAQLDKRARKFPWDTHLPRGAALKVEVTTRKSKIYHAGAAAQRVETALRDVLGAAIDPEATLRLMVRIEDDLCTISLDTSGESLHRRGHKAFVGKAPLRETMAAMFLRACGFDGRESVVDPMCGSGTFVLEAAEIAAGLLPGRSRTFAFEALPTFDPAQWSALKASARPVTPDVRFYGFDRDTGAIAGAARNAESAGVSGWTSFARQAISDLQPPEGKPGLVMVNPPYGARIGDRKLLFGLYGTLGEVLKTRFRGWRVGIVTSDGGLAKATGLPFLPPGPPVPHGGLTVKLYRTETL